MYSNYNTTANYSTFFSSFSWSHTAVLRTHYHISESASDSFADKLLKKENQLGEKIISNLFFTIEKDIRKYRDTYLDNCVKNINHMHMVMNLTDDITKKLFVEILGVNQKQVTYFEKINDKNAILQYVSKEMLYKSSHYNIYINEE